MYKYVYIYTCTHVCKRMIIYVDEYLAPTKKKTIPGFKDLADKHKSVWMGTSMGFANRKEHKVSFC